MSEGALSRDLLDVLSVQRGKDDLRVGSRLFRQLADTYRGRRMRRHAQRIRQPRRRLGAHEPLLQGVDITYFLL